ncbi:hypothetical protein BDR04DRAFT_1116088 [Suillus decipiens]|nr:hypothetical protein BDR04DRAFT_1116088 [Suillus decipiens]
MISLSSNRFAYVIISVHERSSGTEPILSALAATRDNTSAQDSGALCKPFIDRSALEADLQVLSEPCLQDFQMYKAYPKLTLSDRSSLAVLLAGNLQLEVNRGFPARMTLAAQTDGPIITAPTPRSNLPLTIFNILMTRKSDDQGSNQKEFGKVQTGFWPPRLMPGAWCQLCWQRRSLEGVDIEGNPLILANFQYYCQRTFSLVREREWEKRRSYA